MPALGGDRCHRPQTVGQPFDLSVPVTVQIADARSGHQIDPDSGIQQASVRRKMHRGVDVALDLRGSAVLVAQVKMGFARVVGGR